MRGSSAPLETQTIQIDEYFNPPSELGWQGSALAIAGYRATITVAVSKGPNMTMTQQRSSIIAGVSILAILGLTTLRAHAKGPTYVAGSIGHRLWNMYLQAEGPGFESVFSE